MLGMSLCVCVCVFAHVWVHVFVYVSWTIGFCMLMVSGVRFKMVEDEKTFRGNTRRE